MLNKKNYTVILAIILFFVGATTYFLNNNRQNFSGTSSIPKTDSPTPTPDDSHKSEPKIRLGKKEYKQGEPITFNIDNATEYDIFFFPETCASHLVKVYVIQNDRPLLLETDPLICTLAPEVTTLVSEKTITGKIPDKTRSDMSQGKYVIKFEYSKTKRNRFGIGDLSEVVSDVFVVD